MKRFSILITISVIVLAGIVVSIYLLFGRNNRQSINAISAIPIESSVIFKVDNFSNLSTSISENKLCVNLGKIYEFKTVSKILQYTDSIYNNNVSIKNLIDNNPIYVALCTSGNGNCWVASLKLNKNISRNEAMDFIKSQTIGLFSEELSQYNQTSILTLTNSDSKGDSYSMAIVNEVLVISNSKLLVERAIGQIDGGVSLLNNSQFIDIHKISGKGVVANMFINYKQLPAIIKTSVNDNYINNSKTFADLALWTEFDFSFSNNNLNVSGLSNVSDSTNSFLQIITSQKPVHQTLPNILPFNTGAFLWLGISDQKKYLESYRDYLDRKHEIFKYTQKLNSYKSKLGISAEELFEQIMVDQIALAFLPSVTVDDSDCWVIVENTNSPSAAKDLLLKITKHFIKETKSNGSGWKSSITMDRDKKVDVYKFPAIGIHNAVWGSVFPASIDSYFCFIDNNIVFGESIDALSRFVKASLRNNTLGKDVNFNKFSSEISKKGNFCFYANPARSASLIREYTKSPLKQFLISSAQSGVLGLSYQMIGGSEYIFNSFTVTSGKMIRTSTNQTAWVTKLDERPWSKPQIVINHNTREREVFVQDSLNNIYLINSQGRILWKRIVDGQLTGDVEQIDVYRNGRLQFAFSTANSIYVVDRNGKDVSGFPIKLPSEATNPLSVADYENNRNYRLFQACADKKIYVFDSKGKAVNGWTFGKTETTVTHPVQFFKIAGKDYITIFDQNRPYIVNRKGEERVKPNNYFVKAPNSTVSIATNSKGTQCIITSDTLGLVRTISTNGVVESVALKTFSPNHSLVYDDINADGHKDYIVLDGQTLTAFNQKFEVIFTTNFSEKIEPQMLIFKFGDQKKIGLVSTQADNIYLINGKGKTENTFPLQGSTPFSITKFKHSSDTYNLLVGLKQGAVVNYEIR